MFIVLGIAVWVAMCSLILIGASYAAHFEDDYMDRDARYIEHVYTRNISDL
ncbi:hypothetical protein MUN88_02640 [Gracilibacillus caseinilyticus]|uniref:Uncharacterized protein n=1 Tax=Gracilibacillus caseinilyticus TaxID=2932256 RepID=A0ABY4EXB4_9BACI|nr:hypothetical protein [Gracilibacillus caseinilyticus]UOQ49056.1 hypothetical protein MUN88_02640 [Gracilibacillus caseinilyticus]